MSESMRGTRLGATSYEVDKGIQVARSLTTYVCSEGHNTTLPFALEADEIPDTWNCDCGMVGIRYGIKSYQADELKKPKSHWDMLLERRSRADLEELLHERLDLLRGTSKKSA